MLAALGNMEKKLDHLTKLHLETRQMANENHKEILGLKAKVETLERENMEFKKELQEVKESCNRRDQQARELTIRVLGLPVSEDERTEGGKVAVKTAYDRIIKPILASAKTKNLIEVVPQFNNCIEEGYRVGKGASDAQGHPLPPPLLLKLKSKTIKIAIFKCKRDVMAAITDTSIKKAIIVEDLTPPTLKRMKEMKEDRRVEKVWTMEGSIKYTLATKPAVVCRLPSVFKPLNEFLK